MPKGRPRACQGPPGHADARQENDDRRVDVSPLNVMFLEECSDEALGRTCDQARRSWHILA